MQASEVKIVQNPPTEDLQPINKIINHLENSPFLASKESKEKAHVSFAEVAAPSTGSKLNQVTNQADNSTMLDEVDLQPIKNILKDLVSNATVGVAEAPKPNPAKTEGVDLQPIKTILKNLEASPLLKSSDSSVVPAAPPPDTVQFK